VIDSWKERGVDFSTCLYVTEIDLVTGQERHDCGNHKYLFRRAASSIRQGKEPSLSRKAFDDVLMDSYVYFHLHCILALSTGSFFFPKLKVQLICLSYVV